MALALISPFFNIYVLRLTLTSPDVTFSFLANSYSTTVFCVLAPIALRAFLHKRQAIDPTKGFHFLALVYVQ